MYSYRHVTAGEMEISKSFESIDECKKAALDLGWTGFVEITTPSKEYNFDEIVEIFIV